MDSGTSLDVASPAVLRHEIEQTRVAIGEKLTRLQEGVRGTWSEASDQVRTSLEHAKETVNPLAQFHRHPWAFCAAAFAFGMLLQRRAARQLSSAEAELEEAEQAPAQQPGRRRTRGALLSGTLLPLVAEVVRSLVERSRESRPKR